MVLVVDNVERIGWMTVVVAFVHFGIIAQVVTVRVDVGQRSWGMGQKRSYLRLLLLVRWFRSLVDVPSI